MNPEPGRLEIGAALFVDLMSELARRGGGTRESGAFLLQDAHPELAGDGAGWQAVTAVAYYGDLDPGSLTGNITFSASGYTALASRCRAEGWRIAADIHTHPGRWVHQSHTDATHPMVALPGHVALIAPSFAQGPVAISDLGAHVYQGNGQWTSRFGPDVARVLRLTETPAATPLRARLASWFLHRARRLLTPWRSR
ncbi:MAG TPA: hypothetical protein VMU94_26275 [Streptosporangiaceae bacterium]|nr:hypothetical protein [Streptosporangiaceae bacterium]